MLKLMLSLLLTLMITANLKAQNDNLPCLDTQVECVSKLTETAMKNSAQIFVLDKAIELQKKKIWTAYISPDSFNLLGMIFKTAKNLAGGGEVAEKKLTIAQLELRRREIGDELRKRITDLLLRIEADDRKIEQAKILFDAQSSLVAVLEVGYRSGDLSTERMMPAWEKLDYFKIEIENARADKKQAQSELKLVVFPPITREEARSATALQIISAWEISGTKEKLRLVILDADSSSRVYGSELLKLFPKGFDHLPEQLQPREIYPTTKNGKRKVQYIGKAHKSGFNFVVFGYL